MARSAGLKTETKGLRRKLKPNDHKGRFSGEIDMEKIRALKLRKRFLWKRRTKSMYTLSGRWRTGSRQCKSSSEIELSGPIGSEEICETSYASKMILIDPSPVRQNDSIITDASAPISGSSDDRWEFVATRFLPQKDLLTTRWAPEHSHLSRISHYLLKEGLLRDGKQRFAQFSMAETDLCLQTVRVERVKVRNLLEENRQVYGNPKSNRKSVYFPKDLQRNDSNVFFSEGNECQNELLTNEFGTQVSERTGAHSRDTKSTCCQQKAYGFMNVDDLIRTNIDADIRNNTNKQSLAKDFEDVYSKAYWSMNDGVNQNLEMCTSGTKNTHSFFFPSSGQPTSDTEKREDGELKKSSPDYDYSYTLSSTRTGCTETLIGKQLDSPHDADEKTDKKECVLPSSVPDEVLNEYKRTALDILLQRKQDIEKKSAKELQKSAKHHGSDYGDVPSKHERFDLESPGSRLYFDRRKSPSPSAQQANHNSRRRSLIKMNPMKDHKYSASNDAQQSSEVNASIQSIPAWRKSVSPRQPRYKTASKPDGLKMTRQVGHHALYNPPRKSSDQEKDTVDSHDQYTTEWRSVKAMELSPAAQDGEYDSQRHQISLIQSILKSPTAKAVQALGSFNQQSYIRDGETPDTLTQDMDISVSEILCKYYALFNRNKVSPSSSADFETDQTGHLPILCDHMKRTLELNCALREGGEERLLCNEKDLESAATKLSNQHQNLRILSPHRNNESRDKMLPPQIAAGNLEMQTSGSDLEHPQRRKRKEKEYNSERDDATGTRKNVIKDTDNSLRGHHQSMMKKKSPQSPNTRATNGQCPISKSKLSDEILSMPCEDELSIQILESSKTLMQPEIILCTSVVRDDIEKDKANCDLRNTVKSLAEFNPGSRNNDIHKSKLSTLPWRDFSQKDGSLHNDDHPTYAYTDEAQPALTLLSKSKKVSGNKETTAPSHCRKLPCSELAITKLLRRERLFRKSPFPGRPAQMRENTAHEEHKGTRRPVKSTVIGPSDKECFTQKDEINKLRTQSLSMAAEQTKKELFESIKARIVGKPIQVKKNLPKRLENEVESKHTRHNNRSQTLSIQPSDKTHRNTLPETRGKESICLSTQVSQINKTTPASFTSRIKTCPRQKTHASGLNAKAMMAFKTALHAYFNVKEAATRRCPSDCTSLKGIESQLDNIIHTTNREMLRSYSESEIPEKRMLNTCCAKKGHCSTLLKGAQLELHSPRTVMNHEVNNQIREQRENAQPSHLSSQCPSVVNVPDNTEKQNSDKRDQEDASELESDGGVRTKLINNTCIMILEENRQNHNEPNSTSKDVLYKRKKGRSSPSVDSVSLNTKIQLLNHKYPHPQRPAYDISQEVETSFSDSAISGEQSGMETREILESTCNSKSKKTTAKSTLTYDSQTVPKHGLLPSASNGQQEISSVEKRRHVTFSTLRNLTQYQIWENKDPIYNRKETVPDCSELFPDYVTEQQRIRDLALKGLRMGKQTESCKDLNNTEHTRKTLVNSKTSLQRQLRHLNSNICENFIASSCEQKTGGYFLCDIIDMLAYFIERTIHCKVLLCPPFHFLNEEFISSELTHLRKAEDIENTRHSLQIDSQTTGSFNSMQKGHTNASKHFISPMLAPQRRSAENIAWQVRRLCEEASSRGFDCEDNFINRSFKFAKKNNLLVFQPCGDRTNVCTIDTNTCPVAEDCSDSSDDYRLNSLPNSVLKSNGFCVNCELNIGILWIQDTLYPFFLQRIPTDPCIEALETHEEDSNHVLPNLSNFGRISGTRSTDSRDSGSGKLKHQKVSLNVQSIPCSKDNYREDTIVISQKHTDDGAVDVNHEMHTSGGNCKKVAALRYHYGTISQPKRHILTTNRNDHDVDSFPLDDSAANRVSHDDNVWVASQAMGALDVCAETIEKWAKPNQSSAEITIEIKSLEEPTSTQMENFRTTQEEICKDSTSNINVLAVNNKSPLIRQNIPNYYENGDAEIGERMEGAELNRCEPFYGFLTYNKELPSIPRYSLPVLNQHTSHRKSYISSEVHTYKKVDNIHSFLSEEEYEDSVATAMRFIERCDLKVSTASNTSDKNLSPLIDTNERERACDFIMPTESPYEHRSIKKTPDIYKKQIDRIHLEDHRGNFQDLVSTCTGQFESFLDTTKEKKMENKDTFTADDLKNEDPPSVPSISSTSHQFSDATYSNSGTTSVFKEGTQSDKNSTSPDSHLNLKCRSWQEDYKRSHEDNRTSLCCKMKKDQQSVKHDAKMITLQYNSYNVSCLPSRTIQKSVSATPSYGNVPIKTTCHRVDHSETLGPQLYSSSQIQCKSDPNTLQHGIKSSHSSHFQTSLRRNGEMNSNVPYATTEGVLSNRKGHVETLKPGMSRGFELKNMNDKSMLCIEKETPDIMKDDRSIFSSSCSNSTSCQCGVDKEKQTIRRGKLEEIDCKSKQSEEEIAQERHKKYQLNSTTESCLYTSFSAPLPQICDVNSKKRVKFNSFQTEPTHQHYESDKRMIGYGSRRNFRFINAGETEYGGRSSLEKSQSMQEIGEETLNVDYKTKLHSPNYTDFRKTSHHWRLKEPQKNQNPSSVNTGCDGSCPSKPFSSELEMYYFGRRNRKTRCNEGGSSLSNKDSNVHYNRKLVSDMFMEMPEKNYDSSFGDNFENNESAMTEVGGCGTSVTTMDLSKPKAACSRSRTNHSLHSDPGDETSWSYNDFMDLESQGLPKIMASCLVAALEHLLKRNRSKKRRRMTRKTYPQENIKNIPVNSNSKIKDRGISNTRRERKINHFQKSRYNTSKGVFGWDTNTLAQISPLPADDGSKSTRINEEDGTMLKREYLIDAFKSIVLTPTNYVNIANLHYAPDGSDDHDNIYSFQRSFSHEDIITHEGNPVVPRYCLSDTDAVSDSCGTVPILQNGTLHVQPHGSKYCYSQTIGLDRSDKKSSCSEACTSFLSNEAVHESDPDSFMSSPSLSHVDNKSKPIMSETGYNLTYFTDLSAEHVPLKQDANCIDIHSVGNSIKRSSIPSSSSDPKDRLLQSLQTESESCISKSEENASQPSFEAVAKTNQLTLSLSCEKLHIFPMPQLYSHTLDNDLKQHEKNCSKRVTGKGFEEMFKTPESATLMEESTLAATNIQKQYFDQIDPLHCFQDALKNKQFLSESHSQNVRHNDLATYGIKELWDRQRESNRRKSLAIPIVTLPKRENLRSLRFIRSDKTSPKREDRHICSKPIQPRSNPKALDDIGSPPLSSTWAQANHSEEPPLVNRCCPTIYDDQSLIKGNNLYEKEYSRNECPFRHPILNKKVNHLTKPPKGAKSEDLSASQAHLRNVTGKKNNSREIRRSSRPYNVKATFNHTSLGVQTQNIVSSIEENSRETLTSKNIKTSTGFSSGKESVFGEVPSHLPWKKNDDSIGGQVLPSHPLTLEPGKLHDSNKFGHELLVGKFHPLPNSPVGNGKLEYPHNSVQSSITHIKERMSELENKITNIVTRFKTECPRENGIHTLSMAVNSDEQPIMKESCTLQTNLGCDEQFFTQNLNYQEVKTGNLHQEKKLKPSDQQAKQTFYEELVGCQIQEQIMKPGIFQEPIKSDPSRDVVSNEIISRKEISNEVLGLPSQNGSSNEIISRKEIPNEVLGLSSQNGSSNDIISRKEIPNEVLGLSSPNGSITHEENWTSTVHGRCWQPLADEFAAETIAQRDSNDLVLDTTDGQAKERENLGITDDKEQIRQQVPLPDTERSSDMKETVMGSKKEIIGNKQCIQSKNTTRCNAHQASMQSIMQSNTQCRENIDHLLDMKDCKPEHTEKITFNLKTSSKVDKAGKSESCSQSLTQDPSYELIVQEKGCYSKACGNIDIKRIQGRNAHQLVEIVSKDSSSPEYFERETSSEEDRHSIDMGISEPSMIHEGNVSTIHTEKGDNFMENAAYGHADIHVNSEIREDNCKMLNLGKGGISVRSTKEQRCRRSKASLSTVQLKTEPSSGACRNHGKTKMAPACQRHQYPLIQEKERAQIRRREENKPQFQEDCRPTNENESHSQLRDQENSSMGCCTGSRFLVSPGNIGTPMEQEITLLNIGTPMEREDCWKHGGTPREQGVPLMHVVTPVKQGLSLEQAVVTSQNCGLQMEKVTETPMEHKVIEQNAWTPLGQDVTLKNIGTPMEQRTPMEQKFCNYLTTFETNGVLMENGSCGNVTTHEHDGEPMEQETCVWLKTRENGTAQKVQDIGVYLKGLSCVNRSEERTFSGNMIKGSYDSQMENSGAPIKSTGVSQSINLENGSTSIKETDISRSKIMENGNTSIVGQSLNLDNNSTFIEKTKTGQSFLNLGNLGTSIKNTDIIETRTLENSVTAMNMTNVSSSGRWENGYTSMKKTNLNVSQSKSLENGATREQKKGVDSFMNQENRCIPTKQDKICSHSKFPESSITPMVHIDCRHSATEENVEERQEGQVGSVHFICKRNEEKTMENGCIGWSKEEPCIETVEDHNCNRIRVHKGSEIQLVKEGSYRTTFEEKRRNPNNDSQIEECSDMTSIMENCTNEISAKDNQYHDSSIGVGGVDNLMTHRICGDSILQESCKCTKEDDNCVSSVLGSIERLGNPKSVEEKTPMASYKEQAIYGEQIDRQNVWRCYDPPFEKNIMESFLSTELHESKPSVENDEPPICHNRSKQGKCGKESKEDCKQGKCEEWREKLIANEINRQLLALEKSGKRAVKELSMKERNGNKPANKQSPVIPEHIEKPNLHNKIEQCHVFEFCAKNVAQNGRKEQSLATEKIENTMKQKSDDQWLKKNQQIEESKDSSKSHKPYSMQAMKNQPKEATTTNGLSPTQESVMVASSQKKNENLASKLDEKIERRLCQENIAHKLSHMTDTSHQRQNDTRVGCKMENGTAFVIDKEIRFQHTRENTDGVENILIQTNDKPLLPQETEKLQSEQIDQDTCLVLLDTCVPPQPQDTGIRLESKDNEPSKGVTLNNQKNHGSINVSVKVHTFRNVKPISNCSENRSQDECFKCLTFSRDLVKLLSPEYCFGKSLVYNKDSHNKKQMHWTKPIKQSNRESSGSAQSPMNEEQHSVTESHFARGYCTCLSQLNVSVIDSGKGPFHHCNLQNKGIGGKSSGIEIVFPKLRSFGTDEYFGFRRHGQCLLRPRIGIRYRFHPFRAYKLSMSNQSQKNSNSRVFESLLRWKYINESQSIRVRKRDDPATSPYTIVSSACSDSISDSLANADTKTSQWSLPYSSLTLKKVASIQAPSFSWEKQNYSVVHFTGSKLCGKSRDSCSLKHSIKDQKNTTNAITTTFPTEEHFNTEAIDISNRAFADWKICQTTDGQNTDCFDLTCLLKSGHQKFIFNDNGNQTPKSIVKLFDKELSNHVTRQDRDLTHNKCTGDGMSNIKEIEDSIIMFRGASSNNNKRNERKTIHFYKTNKSCEAPSPIVSPLSRNIYRHQRKRQSRHSSIHKSTSHCMERRPQSPERHLSLPPHIERRTPKEIIDEFVTTRARPIQIPIDIYPFPSRRACPSYGNDTAGTIAISGPLMNLRVPVCLHDNCPRKEIIHDDFQIRTQGRSKNYDRHDQSNAIPERHSRVKVESPEFVINPPLASPRRKARGSPLSLCRLRDKVKRVLGFRKN